MVTKSSDASEMKSWVTPLGKQYKLAKVLVKGK